MVSRFFAAASLAFALAVASPPTRAQQPQELAPSHVAAARELVLLIGVAASADEIIPALVADMKRQSVTRPEMGKDLDEVLKTLAPELESLRQQAITSISRSYAKWLTEAELKDVIVFYKTPVGAKFSNVQSDIVEDAVKEMGAWSAQVSEYLITRTRVEMKKRGHEMQ